jgi:hypothetical protein
VTGEEGARLVVELTRTVSALRLLHGAERDFTAWLQAEVCRARQWTVADLLVAWQEELDRRACAKRWAI